MNALERSFSGKTFQPKPESFLSSSCQFFTVITPWGVDNFPVKDVFDELESEYNFFAEDSEKTYPSPQLVSLSSIQNSMRISVMQVNSGIFHKINEEEYTTGFELFYAILSEQVCSFIQIGCPVVLLDRPQQPLQVIGQNTQWLWPGTSSSPSPPSPLPRQLLGLYPDISFHPMSFHFQPGDKLVLLNRNAIPAAWFHTRHEERTLDHLSQLAVQADSRMPFWLSVVSLSKESTFST